MADITLTAAMRNNLTNLQSTAMLLSQTQNRLATGKKVNSALDNPSNFFSAVAHNQRASDLTARKDGMTEAVQGIKAADAGVTGVVNLLQAAKGILETARSTAQSGLASLQTQFNTVMTQVSKLVSDSGYKGTNFLKGTSVSLDVLFNETGTNKLTMNGFNAKVSGLVATKIISKAAVTGGFSNLAANVTKAASFIAGSNARGSTAAGAVGFSNAYNINALENGLNAAISQLQVQSAKMASNLSIVNTRLDFTTSTVNVEKTGADNLTLADQNEEGANMLMLQTRNQLGISSLSMASQAAQGILKLF